MIVETMNHKGLLEVSAFVLDTYDKNTQSVEEHVNRCLKEYGVSTDLASNIKEMEIRLMKFFGKGLNE